MVLYEEQRVTVYNWTELSTCNHIKFTIELIYHIDDMHNQWCADNELSGGKSWFIEILS